MKMETACIGIFMLYAGKAVLSSCKYSINIFCFKHILFTAAYEWDSAKKYTYTSCFHFHAQGIPWNAYANTSAMVNKLKKIRISAKIPLSSFINQSEGSNLI
jgi:hypothetical protein